MAVYTITATAVVPPSTNLAGGIAGEAIAAGDVPYFNATDKKLYKADSDDTDAKAAVVGIAANSAAAGQPVNYATEGEITVDAGLFTTPGVAAVLVLSPTAGKMQDVGDLATTERVVILGFVSAANKFILKIVKSGLAIP